MISNFHQSSGPDETSSSYYTFDEPSHLSGGGGNNGGKNKKQKKKKKMGGRIFGGLGRSGNKQQRKSAELEDWRPPHMMLDDGSTTLAGQSLVSATEQSLTYSTSAASYQTTGESTNSSDDGAFADILRLLDEEDAREIREKRKNRWSYHHHHHPGDRSLHSSTSSLAYSEGGTTLNYSEDGDRSELEGTKLLGMLGDSPSMHQAAGGSSEEGDRDELLHPSARPAASATTPVVAGNKPTSHRPTEDDGQRRAQRRREREEIEGWDGDPASSSRGDPSYANRWFCGMDFGEAGTALRPFLCF